MARKHRTTEEKLELIRKVDARKAKGESPTSASEAEGIRPGQYHDWKHRLKKKQALVVKTKPAPRYQRLAVETLPMSDDVAPMTLTLSATPATIADFLRRMRG